MAAAALVITVWALALKSYDTSSFESRDNVGPPIVAGPALSFITFQRCRSHIDQNFERLSTVRQIALECHLSDVYLRRLFHRFGHQSPAQYLAALKKSRADELRRLSGNYNAFTSVTNSCNAFLASPKSIRVLGL
jgi:AraC-like DNA-binding protein